jgi:hypothetical protein
MEGCQSSGEQREHASWYGYPEHTLGEPKNWRLPLNAIPHPLRVRGTTRLSLESVQPSVQAHGPAALTSGAPNPAASVAPTLAATGGPQRLSASSVRATHPVRPPAYAVKAHGLRVLNHYSTQPGCCAMSACFQLSLPHAVRCAGGGHQPPPPPPHIAPRTHPPPAPNPRSPHPPHHHCQTRPAAMAYCTEDNFEISPGVFTHNFTVDQVEANPDYGCCQVRRRRVQRRMWCRQGRNDRQNPCSRAGTQPLLRPHMFASCVMWQASDVA